MKILYSVTNSVQIELEGSNLKEIFQQQAVVDEIFKVTQCGDKTCKGTDLSHVVREKDGNKYFELRCNKCFARLSFGQGKNQSSLYPRRRYHKEHPEVKAGRANVKDLIPNNGFERYVRTEEEA